jgi:hypothetical protein
LDTCQDITNTTRQCTTAALILIMEHT